MKMSMVALVVGLASAVMAAPSPVPATSLAPTNDDRVRMIEDLQAATDDLQMREDERLLQAALRGEAVEESIDFSSLASLTLTTPCTPGELDGTETTQQAKCRMLAILLLQSEFLRCTLEGGSPQEVWDCQNDACFQFFLQWDLCVSAS